MHVKDVQAIFDSFRDKKVIVLGDLMLDRYLWGRVTRISPEAPVPVVEIDSEFVRLGGAANVANNVAALGAQPLAIGIIGADTAGEKVRQLFQEYNFSTAGLIVDKSRCTTEKTRVIAHNQHVVRTDREVKTPISAEIFQAVLNCYQQLLPQADAIIFQDYNKGLIFKELIEVVIRRARSYNKIITVDPKFQNFFDYKQVTVMKPNKKEAEQTLGAQFQSPADVIQAGRMIRTRLDCKNVLITLGEQGMCLVDAEDQSALIPTTARKVHDVSGAGDTVISVLTVALAAGLPIELAARFANFAAGLVCEEVGVVPVDRQKLLQMVISQEVSA